MERKRKLFSTPMIMHTLRIDVIFPEINHDPKLVLCYQIMQLKTLSFGRGKLHILSGKYLIHTNLVNMLKSGLTKLGKNLFTRAIHIPKRIKQSKSLFKRWFEICLII